MIWAPVRNTAPKTSSGATHHLVAAPDKDGHRPGVGALLNHQHLFPRGAEAHLADDTRPAELGGAEILKPGHDAAVGGDGDEHDFRSAHPPDGRQMVLEEQMVGLVVETPLADGQIGARGLYLVNHLDKLLALVRLQLLELFDARDVEPVLRLGLWRLERACEDGDLGVPHLGRHLGVREVLVDDDALDEKGVLQRAAHLSIHLDELKVDVLALEVRHREDRVNGDVGKLVVRLGDDLAAQARPGHLDQVGSLLLAELDHVRDLVELGNGDVAGLVVPVGDPDGVDSLVDELGGLLQERAGENHDTGGAVTDLVVLRLGELHQQLGDVVRDLHFLQNGRAIVCYCDVAVRGDDDLVEAARPEGGLDDVRDGAGGENVGLDSFAAKLALLLALAGDGGVS